MNAQKHITLVAVLHLIHSGLGLLIGLFLFALLSGIGVVSGDEEAVIVLSIVAAVIGFFFLVICLPGIIGAIALLNRARWSRIFMLIIGALSLIDIPFGTALGIYTFYALMREDVIQALDPPQTATAVVPA